MRQFSIPTFSPDGISGGRAQHQRDVVADAYATITILAEAAAWRHPRLPRMRASAMMMVWSTTMAGPVRALTKRG